jgi:hypothetical protein
MTRKSWQSVAAVFGAMFVMAPASILADEFIAGVEPSQRPAGAPVIASFNKDAAWYRHALSGVVAPYPPSLRFLENQGAWYTPFNRPGLTGPYDIRNWHGSATGSVGRSVQGK